MTKAVRRRLEIGGEIENRLAAQGRKLADTSLDEMERIWVEVKMGEKKKAG